MVRRWLGSDIAVLIKRLAVVYLALTVCRVLFYLCNMSVCGSIAWSELWPMFRGVVQFDSASVIYAYGVFVLLSLLPLRVRERGWYDAMLQWYYAVMGTLVVAINLADIVYFRYTQSRFSAHEFFFMENDNTASLMWKFGSENWYLIVAWVAIVWGMMWLYKRCGRPVTPIRNVWGYTFFSTTVLLCAVTLSIWVLRGYSFRRDARPIAVTHASAYATSSAKATMILSNPFSILRTMSNRPVKAKQYFDSVTLAKIYTLYHFPAAPSDTVSMNFSSRGVLKGRNVVIFVLESFSAEHSGLLNPDLYPEGGGYTPFLDSLMRGGYLLRNAYATGRKSIDALPSVWGSVPSYKTPFVLLPQALKEGQQLPKLLRGEGYETAFFCGSPAGSMGFEAYARASGVNNVYSMESYQKSHEGNYDGFWGIWDEPFIDYMGETLSQTRQPFFSTIFTLSSHHPFVVPDKYREVLPKGSTKEHQPVGYTDLSVRRFFEHYSGQEWFQNTLFVFVADHVSSERFAPKTETSAGRRHIITFFYTPDGALRGDDGGVFQQTDIMPTVLGLLGYDKPYFAFGRDIFNEPERMALAVNYDGQFQAIGERMTILFDEQSVVAAYSREDTLQRENLVGTASSQYEPILEQLKAQIQQYYEHLNNSRFTIHDSQLD